MFTSGSTGRPKGVCVPHRAIVRLVLATDYIALAPDDVVAQASNASFDAATFEIWGALLNGSRLVLVSRDTVLAPAELARALPRSGVTVLFLTTALFNQLVAEAPRCFATLRVVLTGGEAADPRAMARFLEANPGVELRNVYGPTESTTFATTYRVDEVPPGATHIPIGRPIANTRAYVLDRHREPTPIGVPGELYLGGDGLAEGYRSAPELTEERFVADPFGLEPHGRLYRTGDVVRIRADGNIEFLGRVDHQVKVRGFRVELPEIETVLAQHPAVRQTAVALDRGDGDDARVVAYVVADARHFEEAAAEGAGAATGEHRALVEQWKEVFENIVYDSIDAQLQPRTDPTFNILGWNSSYTGEPIPAGEMREQVEATVARIAEARPQRILEIGCGTGLLLFRLAPQARRFVGTDFSPAALEFVRRVLDGDPERYGEVELLQRLADNFDGLTPGSFDTVILNSVVQYLPSIHDLLRVIDGAFRVLAPRGTIFLGDLRSHSLLHALHSSVQLYRAADEVTVAELRERIQRNVQQEQELTIDPAFWGYLQELYPRIDSVQVQQKRGLHANELTRFRYDVRLTVGTERQEPPRIPWRHWGREGMDPASLERLLQAERPAQVAFRHVPNARLRMEAAALSQLAGMEDGGSVAALRAAVRAAAGTGVEPEELWQLAASLGYEALIRWPDSGGAEGEMDVLFVRHDAEIDGRDVHFAPSPAPGAQLPDFANNPLQGKFVRNLVPHLQSFLADRLPDYMAPAAYVLLDVLPLTPSGKVDRAALPKPDRARPRLARPFVAPRSTVEDRLAQIWSEVLGVDEVGVVDGFFTELGGHSLLATQVVSRVRAAFGVELPLRTMFETPTVAALAGAIEALQHAPASLAAPEPVTAAPADDVLDVTLLSDEEVDRMLRELGAGGSTGAGPAS
jgi:acyl-coenzyme A synthetase/AMP-(fatty) acid ligase/ubiquinone/menaquinone biosynthesis C-methylase UbiE/acyl carrier protein